MAIQVRRGLKKDFIPEKLLPGEWAVSIDSETENQIVWMCFAPGVTKRMGTYEDFRKQIEEISDGLLDDYKAELNVIKSAVETIASDVSTDKDAVVTIKADITDTLIPQIQQLVNQAEEFKDNAKTSADNALESSNTAQGFAQNASDNAELSSDFATMAESFTHGGTGKREGEDTDNAKYYMEQAKNVIGGDFVSHDEVGKPNGVASLDASGKVPEEQIPMSKVDVDTELSEESENPVQNKVITAEISKLNSDLVSLEGRQGVSNPNLLDNGWFTINQRNVDLTGLVIGTSKNQYMMDRWTSGYWGGKYILNENGLTVEKIASNSAIYQFVKLSDLQGKTVTFSTVSNIGEIAKVTCTIPNTLGDTDVNQIVVGSFNVDKYGVSGLRIDYIASKKSLQIIVYNIVNIKAVKLELGTESTLHLDTAPDEAEELIRCCNSTADPEDTYANGYNPLISDVWVQRTWTTGEICISDNKLWKALVNNSEKPSEGTNWHQTNIASELKNIYTLLSKNNIK